MASTTKIKTMNQQQLLKLLLSVYWKGRRYQQHLDMFGKENADSKSYLSDSVKIEREVREQLNQLLHIK